MKPVLVIDTGDLLALGLLIAAGCLVIWALFGARIERWRAQRRHRKNVE